MAYVARVGCGKANVKGVSEGGVNHCVDCGAVVSRGRWHTTGENTVRCLICQVKADLRGWRFESAVMKLRKKAQEKETGG